MAKNIGKIFEEEIKASIPPAVFIERYKDDTAGFYGVSNPADYRLYKYPYTYLWELKSHKGKSLPLTNIRYNQLFGLAKAVQYIGVHGGYIINFRDLQETYYISVQRLTGFVADNSRKRKSIPVDWCRDNGIKIEQEKKRVRYSYNIAKLMEDIIYD